MPKLPCSVCSHPEAERIDKLLAERTACRVIAEQFGISKISAQRHRANHLGVRIQSKAFLNAPHYARVAVHQAVTAALHGNQLVDEVKRLKQKADALGAQAEANDDVRTALLAVRELTRLVELQGRLALDASAGRAADVANHPVWLELSGLITTALLPYPDARAAVMSVIARRLGKQLPALEQLPVR